MVKPGKKYKILAYPNIGSTAVMNARVLAIYNNPLHGRLVEYRYNGFLPIVRQVKYSEFESWIATEENQDASK